MSALGDLVNGKSGGSGTTSTPTPAGALGGAAPSTPYYAGPTAAAPAAHHGGEGLGGILGEAGHLVAGAVPGLVKFGATIAGDVPRDIGYTWQHRNADHGFGAIPAAFEAPFKVSHTVHQIGQSFARTGGDIVHPTHFVQAYDQGHLLGKVVEDLANASVVGGAVSKPLAATAEASESAATAAEQAAEQAAKDATERAAEEQSARQAASQGPLDPAADARVGQASQAAREAESRAAQLSQDAEDARARADRIGSFSEHVQNFQKLTGTASNPLELAGKGVKALVGGADLPAGLGHFPGIVPSVANIDPEGAIGRGLSHVPILSHAPAGAQGLVEAAAKHGEKQALKADLRQQQFVQSRAFAPAFNAGVDRAKIFKGLGKAADTEQTASTLAYVDKRAQATAPIYQHLLASGRDDLADEYVVHQADAEGVKPAALKLAYRALDPTESSPELDASRARMQQSADIYRTRQQQPAEQAFTSLRGESVTGDERTALAEWRRKSLGTEPVHGDATSPAERNLIENAPKRFRPLLQSGVAAGTVLDRMAQDFTHSGDAQTADLLTAAKADAITNLDQAVHEGVDPTYVQGGELPEHGPSGRASQKLPRAGKTGSRTFGSGENQPTSIVDQTRLITQRWRQITDNEAAQHLQQSLGTTPTDILGDTAKTMSAAELSAWAKREELVPWDPASPFEKLAPGQVNADTAFIPKHLLDTYRHSRPSLVADHLPTVPAHLLKGYDRATQAAVSGFLYYSPRWVVGHSISHAIISSFGAGISPVDLAHAWRQAYHVVRGEEIPGGASPAVSSLLSEGKYAPGELIGRGFPGIDATMQERLTPGHSVLGSPKQWSKGAVAFTDDLNRVAIAIAKKEQGWTAAERDAFRTAHPELAGTTDDQLLNEYSIRESLKAQGDFTNLTNAEREFVGRIVLFYPWIKHITALAADLAIHHPLRVAWALHLADLYGPHSQTPLTQGKIPLGNQWFESIPKVNPFGDIFSNLGATGTGISPLGALNPVLSTALSAGLGYNAAKGSLLERPPGYGNTDQYGRTSWGPLGTGANTPAPKWLTDHTPSFLHGAEARLQPLLNVVANESPQVSAASETIPALFGHAPIVRYPTGEGEHVGHQDIAADPGRLAPFSGGGSLAPLLSLLGIPNASQIDEKAILARVAARRKQLESQRNSYQQLLPGRAP